MDAITEEPRLKPGKYRHYSGKEYEVIGLVCHSETLQWHVLYKPLYEHQGMPDLWVRPYDMFIEEVTVNGDVTRRFTPVDT